MSPSPWRSSPTIFYYLTKKYKFLIPSGNFIYVCYTGEKDMPCDLWICGKMENSLDKRSFRPALMVRISLTSGGTPMCGSIPDHIYKG